MRRSRLAVWLRAVWLLAHAPEDISASANASTVLGEAQLMNSRSYVLLEPQSIAMEAQPGFCSAQFRSARPPSLVCAPFAQGC